MQFIKTICVVTVLGALAYGAYTTLTSSPPADPPAGAATNWDSPPDVELPEGLGPPTATLAASSAAPGGAAPRYSAGAPTTSAPPAAASTNADSGAARIAPGGPITGASITSVRPLGEQAPLPYPSTNVPPGPFDGGVQQAGGSPPQPAATSGPFVVASNSSAGPSLGPSLGSAGGIVPQSFTAPASSATSDTPAKSLEKVQALVAQNKTADALDLLSQWFDHSALSPDEAQSVHLLLDQLAGSVIYSREHLLEPPHTVAQGETLQAIAQRYQVPAELLMKINGIADPLYLPAGTQLKVLKGPFDALVDKSRGQLTLFLEGMYAGSFAIGIGQDLKLPDGTYAVTAKLTNPTFQAADVVVAADDPNNPLGERWIDLGGGQGIHGRPASAVGFPENGGRGMIYLGNRQEEDIYDILSVGSKVMIRP